MPTLHRTADSDTEPLRRFYPPEGMRPQLQKESSLQTMPERLSQFPQKQMPEPRSGSRRKADDADYFMHRHPILLQRLYQAADTILDTYPKQAFVYDAYPDSLSLRLMRDRMLRENPALTEEFLQAGCPVIWLNLLTDTVISELLCRKRCPYRNPRGEASTTSVTSATRS